MSEIRSPRLQPTVCVAEVSAVRLTTMVGFFFRVGYLAGAVVVGAGDRGGVAARVTAVVVTGVAATIGAGVGVGICAGAVTVAVTGAVVEVYSC